MRNWFRFFRIWFLVCGIIIIICVISMIWNKENAVNYERVNTYCTENERVFDYGDVLTDEEEDKLRALIAEKEQVAHCDIILLTMKESLEEYAKAYDPNVPSNKYVMIKADNFYDEYGFGWNKTKESDDGDGCILLDNWFRESDGKIHTWLSTSGSVERKFSSGMIDRVLDDVYDYVEYDPYRAYKAYIEDIARYMGNEESKLEVPLYAYFVIPTIAAIIFIAIYASGKEGRKTVNESTYVGENGINFEVMYDQFISKAISQRRIERSDSGGYGGGGGGGHHISSGGQSHGGGGHSR